MYRLWLIALLLVFLSFGCSQKKAIQFNDQRVGWKWSIPSSYELRETELGYRIYNTYEFPVLVKLSFIERTKPELLNSKIQDFQSNTQSYGIARPSANQEEIQWNDKPFTVFNFSGERQAGAARLRHSDKMLIGKLDDYWIFIAIEGMNPNKVERFYKELMTSVPN